MQKNNTQTLSTMIPADLAFSTLARKTSQVLFEYLKFSDK